jgi:hypothetical protein
MALGLDHPLFFIGVVENNDDPQLEGRVQVRAFGIHGTRDQVPTTELPWALCSRGEYGLIFSLPSLNSFVWGMFVDGEQAQQPIILGLLPSQLAEPISPAKYGWGVIPHRDGDLLAKGSAPRDFGQPQNSRLTRGEDVHETYVLGQEMNRCEEMKIAGKDEVWSEPSSAYATNYPHNKTIETTHHSIELDDTPGAERIMIRHKEGGYIQIDSKGNMTQKSTGDQFDISCGNKHEYVETKHVVTIGGDAHVYVKGNKIEEIEGDYQQIVHGNSLYSSGGQITILGSEQVQVAAADVKLEAKVGTLGIKAAKNIQLDSLSAINMTSLREMHSTAFTYEVTSGQVINMITGTGGAFGDINMTSSNMFITSTGAAPPVTPNPLTAVGTPLGLIPEPTKTAAYALQPGFFMTALNANIQTAAVTSINALGLLEIEAEGLININALAAMNIKSTGYLQMAAGAVQVESDTLLNLSSAVATQVKGLTTTIEGTSSLDIFGAVVAIDTLVNIGSGVASPATITPIVPVPTTLVPPWIPTVPFPVLPTEGTKVPNPPSKSTKIHLSNPAGSGSSGGFVSPDPDVES